MKILATTLFVVAGVVNLLPCIGVVSAARLEALYGVVLEDPNLIILMRHRAVLFGVVGLLLIAAAFHIRLRPLGLAAGLASMLSFVVLAGSSDGYNAQLLRVVWVDLAGSALLLGGGIAGHVDRRRRTHAARL